VELYQLFIGDQWVDPASGQWFESSEPISGKARAEIDGLLATRLPNGTGTRLPRVSIRIGEQGFDLTCDPPGEGADSRDILGALSIEEDRIAALIDSGVIVQEKEAHHG
jgi:hypothetical protein